MENAKNSDELEDERRLNKDTPKNTAWREINDVGSIVHVESKNAQVPARLEYVRQCPDMMSYATNAAIVQAGPESVGKQNENDMVQEVKRWRMERH